MNVNELVKGPDAPGSGQPPVEIKAFVRIHNGNKICKANMGRLRLVSTKPYSMSTPEYILSRGLDPAAYRATYRVRHDPKKGFIFWETVLDHGCSGYHKTLRGLILATLCGLCGDRLQLFLDPPNYFPQHLPTGVPAYTEPKPDHHTITDAFPNGRWTEGRSTTEAQSHREKEAA